MASSSTPDASADSAVKSAQSVIDDFWKTKLLSSNATSKPSIVLPENVFTHMAGDRASKDDAIGCNVLQSYDEAVKECEAKVSIIVAECRRSNTRYTDPHFNLDDFNMCLDSLTARTNASVSDDQSVDPTVICKITQTASLTSGPIPWANLQPDAESSNNSNTSEPACAKRIGKIFTNPKFYVERDAHAKDIRQGVSNDCWFLASLGCLCVDEQFPLLIERLCPVKARDEKVGVYGFVFYRDGEWISEIIDDKLYLSAPDYDDCDDNRRAVWDSRTNSRTDPTLSREEYRKTFQTNSDALYFGTCAQPDETWVPLIEKAFAKAHGDYDALNFGWPGEGVEDLTGGVTTMIICDDILDEDRLWTEGFLNVNKNFLFSAGTRDFNNKQESQRQGIADGHAYSLLRAVKYGDERLCLLKNPWGMGEYDGPWSDGSKEWTPEALKALDHQFGNDGIFWMPFADFLRRYYSMWRTRLFTPDWNVTQKWTSLQVPWLGEYIDTRFEFELPQATTAVIVLSQLDDRYFRGLTGQYRFELAFRVHRKDEKAHLIRGSSNGVRSASAEIEMEAGTYEVFLQIRGQRYTSLPTIEEVVKQNWLSRREKLVRTGLSHDLAFAKGRIEEPEPKEETKVENKETAPVSKAVQTETTDTAKPEAVVSSGPEGTEAAQPEATSATTEAKVGSTPEVPPGDAQDTGADTAEPAAKSPSPEDAEVGAPWDASCVVGLRIFCQKASATIKVVKPRGESATLDKKVKLDVDDAEKDAAEKTAGKEATSSTLPLRESTDRLP